MDFELSQEQRMIYEYGNSLVKQFDRKYWLACAEQKRFPQEMYDKVAADGFVGMMVPEAYGGAGQGMTEMHLFLEGLSNHGIPLLSLVVGATMSVGFIAKYGTEEQKKRYLPDACKGRTRFCFAITEPGAGTNTIQITSIAKKNGDRYSLSGQKVFISGARDADFMLVVARTTRAAEVKNRTEGMSLFVLDMKTPGIKLQQLNIQVETAERQYMVFFDNVELPTDALIGEAGKGAKLMFEGLNSERLLAAGAAIGLGDYALAKAVAYAKDRKPFGKPIGSYQALQHRMAQAKAQIEAARLMTYNAAERFDNGEDAGAHANMAKLLGSQAAVAAVEAALQTHGGYGFDRDYDIVTLWPMVRLLEIAPINNEMLLNYIGEHVLGLPKSY